jgi:hypothetical protein
MSRTARTALVVLGALAALFALHVQLNLGGWSHFAKRGGGGEARGELVVGFLPVT